MNKYKGAEGKSCPSVLPQSDVDAYDHVWTEDEIVAYCIAMQPSKAAELSDSSLCVSPLIEWMYVDGEPQKLSLVDGRWGAGVVRVSTPIQRSGRANLTTRRKKSQRKIEGYSEEDQIRRSIRHYTDRGQAWKCYSDAGVTGEYPNNDPVMIKRLWAKKAARYKKIFERTLLDEASIQRRKPEEVASMRAYLKRRAAMMEDGTITEDELYKDEKSGIDPHFHPHGGRPNPKTSHRQAFTQLWIDVAADRIHTVAAADRSRLCRDADLETSFLEVVAAHGTRLHGLFEDMSFIDVSDPLKKGLNYMIASLNEHRIEEITSACFRGVVQLMESGYPNGRLPWWLQRDEDGRAEFIEGGRDAALRVIGLYLDGYGKGAIGRKLYDEGFRVNGKPITRSQVHLLLHGDAKMGVAWRYGLAWNVYPVVTDDPDIIAAIQDRIRSQRAAYPCLPVPSEDKTVFGGLLRCGCGNRMRFQRQLGGMRTIGRRGMWMCQVGHVADKCDKHHSTLNHAYILEFIRELFVYNPAILSGALAASLGGPNADRAARRAMLEEQLSRAVEALNLERRGAEASAREAVLKLGLAESSPRFASLVEEMTKGLLDVAVARVDSLKMEVTRLRAQADHDRRATEFSESVKSLGTWDDLDPHTQHRLLRSVIEVITVYSRAEGAHLVIKLVGVEEPLPPIHRYALNATQLRLPTPAEWIARACGVSEQEPMRLRRDDMEPFRTYVRRERFDGPEQALAKRISNDASYPKCSTQRGSNLRYLQDNGISEEERRTFQILFDSYVRAQRARKEAKVARQESGERGRRTRSVDSAIIAQKP